MTLVQNGLEGLTSGTTVTAANSGGTSGDAFTTVAPDSSTVVADNTFAAHGAISLKMATTTAMGPYVAYTITSSAANGSLRAYCYIEGYPTSNTNILRLYSGSTIVGTLRINTTGKLGLLYGTGTLGNTSTTTLPLNAWFRIEFQVTPGTGTAATVQAMIYLTPDSTTPTETLTSSGITVATAASVTQARYGVISSVANWTVWFDDLAFGDAGYIGPVSSGGTPITKDVAERYRITNAITKDVVETYRVTNAISKDVAEQYRVLAAISKDVAERYRVTNAITKDTAEQYRVLNAISKDVAEQYAVMNATAITKDVIERYRLYNALSKDVAEQYRVTNALSKDVIERYRVTNALVKDVAESYRVLNAVDRYTLERYRIFNPFTKDVAERYAITASNPSLAFTVDLAERYRILGALSKDVVEQYRVLNGISKDLVERYRLTGSITRDVAEVYRIFTALSVDLVERYRVLSDVVPPALPVDVWYTYAPVAVSASLAAVGLSANLSPLTIEAK